jgi:hypothetical protein
LAGPARRWHYEAGRLSYGAAGFFVSGEATSDRVKIAAQLPNAARKNAAFPLRYRLDRFRHVVNRHRGIARNRRPRGFRLLSAVKQPCAYRRLRLLRLFM